MIYYLIFAWIVGLFWKTELLKGGVEAIIAYIVLVTLAPILIPVRLTLKLLA